jgi:hypothetical protein
MNEELVLIKDTRSLEERLEDTIAMAMNQIAEERNKANKEMEFYNRVWAS